MMVIVKTYLYKIITFQWWNFYLEDKKLRDSDLLQYILFTCGS